MGGMKNMGLNIMAKNPKVNVFLGTFSSGKSTLLEQAVLLDGNKDNLTIINTIKNTMELKKKGVGLTRYRKAEILSINSFQEAINEQGNIYIEGRLDIDNKNSIFSTLNLLKEAKKQGYEIHGNYVFATDLDTLYYNNLNAVAQGKAEFVEKEKLEQGFKKGLEVIIENNELFDSLNFFDNTNHNYKQVEIEAVIELNENFRTVIHPTEDLKKLNLDDFGVFCTTILRHEQSKELETLKQTNIQEINQNTIATLSQSTNLNMM